MNLRKQKEDTTQIDLIGKYFLWEDRFDQKYRKTYYLVLAQDKGRLLVYRSVEYVRAGMQFCYGCAWHKNCVSNGKGSTVHVTCTELKTWLSNLNEGWLQEIPSVLGMLHCGVLDCYTPKEEK